jgi:hypothetical protein
MMGERNMLEAVYRERRNPNAMLSPKAARLIFKMLFVLGGFAFFAVAYFAHYYPEAWTSGQTGQPLTANEGAWVGRGFGVGGLIFLLVAWASDRLPMFVNGKMIDDPSRKGTAWQISAAGLNNSAWGEKTVPWSALDYVQDDVDRFGEPCLIFYFTGKPAVAQYLSEKEAAEWTPGAGYGLEVATTNVSMTQTRAALERYCPRLFRHYDTAEPAGFEPTNDAA